MEEAKNNNILRITFLLLSIMVAIVIFMFSNQDSKKSSNVSEGLVKKIIDILPKTRELSEEEKQRIVKKSQPVVRKLAHFSIYTLLGINVILFLKTFSLMKKKQVLFTIFVCIIYAISDEIHQSFSAGRTPLVKDVCIDVLGGIFGICIVCLIQSLTKKGKKRNKFT